MNENADFENNRIIGLTNLGNILSDMTKLEQDNLNADLPLLLLMIGILTDDINRINYVKNRWGEERFVNLIQMQITDSPWTLGVLCNMRYSIEDFTNNGNQRPPSPMSITEYPYR